MVEVGNFFVVGVDIIFVVIKVVFGLLLKYFVRYQCFKDEVDVVFKVKVVDGDYILVYKDIKDFIFLSVCVKEGLCIYFSIVYQLF